MSSLIFGTNASPEQTLSAAITGPTTYLLPSGTKPRQIPSSRYDEDERTFLCEILKRDAFGAFNEGCMVRKREDGFSRQQLAERIGKDKTGLSKLLRGPANWTLRTLSDVANAIDMDVKIVLLDRIKSGRYFDRTGLHHTSSNANRERKFQKVTVHLGMSVNNIFPKTINMQRLPDKGNEMRGVLLENNPSEHSAISNRMITG